MSEIFNSANQKIGYMEENNHVRNAKGVVVGSVLNNGDVYNTASKIGKVDGRGFIWEGGRHAGTVFPDGVVRDYSNQIVGRVVGGHIYSGGAALLLLLRI